MPLAREAVEAARALSAGEGSIMELTQRLNVAVRAADLAIREVSRNSSAAPVRAGGRKGKKKEKKKAKKEEKEEEEAEEPEAPATPERPSAPAAETPSPLKRLVSKLSL